MTEDNNAMESKQTFTCQINYVKTGSKRKSVPFVSQGLHCNVRGMNKRAMPHWINAPVLSILGL